MGKDCGSVLANKVWVWYCEIVQVGVIYIHVLYRMYQPGDNWGQYISLCTCIYTVYMWEQHNYVLIVGQY